MTNPNPLAGGVGPLDQFAADLLKQSMLFVTELSVQAAELKPLGHENDDLPERQIHLFFTFDAEPRKAILILDKKQALDIYKAIGATYAALWQEAPIPEPVEAPDSKLNQPADLSYLADGSIAHD